MLVLFPSNFSFIILIISSSIIQELSQVESLINNEKLKIKFEEWNQRFNEIKSSEIPKITDGILEIENLLENNSYKELESLISKSLKSKFMLIILNIIYSLKFDKFYVKFIVEVLLWSNTKY